MVEMVVKMVDEMVDEIRWLTHILLPLSHFIL